MTQTYTADISLAEYILGLANDNTLEDHLSTVYPMVMLTLPVQRVTLTIGRLYQRVLRCLEAPSEFYAVCLFVLRLYCM